ncbi:hypothetical protein C357_03960, partial [Citreicella sp. 357]
PRNRQQANSTIFCCTPQRTEQTEKGGGLARVARALLRKAEVNFIV